jgi:DNA-binding MarR family transcriptional regulator
MMQAINSTGTSATRDVVTTAAANPVNAALVGAVFDLVLTLRRDQIGPSATMPVLVRLAADGAMRSCDLAHALHLDQSTVSRHVASLEADGLVQRTPLEDDRRAHRIGLTASGTLAAHRAVGTRVRQFEAAVAGWPEDDIALLARLLTAFVDGLSAHEGNPA